VSKKGAGITGSSCPVKGFKKEIALILATIISVTTA